MWIQVSRVRKVLFKACIPIAFLHSLLLLLLSSPALEKASADRLFRMFVQQLF